MKPQLPEHIADQVRDRFVGMPTVLALVGVSRGTIYNLKKAGTFPPAYKLGPRRVGWSLNEVLAWIEQRKSKQAA